MKLKFNPANIMFVILGVFCAVILTVVITAKIGDPVQENYYEKDISYSKDLDKENNANKLQEALRFETAPDGLKIVFPEQFQAGNVSGKVKLMRYADKNLDRDYPISFSGTHEMIIPKKDLTEGEYQITVDWSSVGVSYLVNQKINVEW